MDEFTTLEDLTKPNKRLAKFEELIAKLNQPGDYFAHGRSIVPMPRIEVEPVGLLSFPVPEFQVRQLLDSAEQSPFGRGTATIIDPKVRDSRQFEPVKVQITGKTWEQTFKDILYQATKGLGCPEDSISADFYKLLVYDTGGFFSPHRDTEKADGMVATLVISLPVIGTGGEIVIRHNGQEQVISMTTDDPAELYWVTFYADCEHEIRPVTSGHRICLVYNLLVNPGKSLPAPPPEANVFIKPLAKELKSITRKSSRDNKLIWVLEHDYTEAGLSFGTLKNTDATIGGILLAIAKMTDHVICTAILDVHDTIDLGFDEDYDLPEHIETISSLKELKPLIESDVVPCELFPFPGEMMPEGGLDTDLADEDDYYGPTGNAGATRDRIYHNAALVFWPRNETLFVAKSASPGICLIYLSDLWQKALDDKQPPEQLRDLANHLLEQLLTISFEDVFEPKTSITAKNFLQTLVENVSNDKLQIILRSIVFSCYNPDLNDILISLAKRLPEGKVSPQLIKFVAEKSSTKIGNFVDLADRIYDVCSGENIRQGSSNPISNQTLQKILSVIIENIPKVGLNSGDWYWHRTLPLSEDKFICLFSLTCKLGLKEELVNLSRAMIEREDLVKPDVTLPGLLPKLIALGHRNIEVVKVLNDLWYHSARFLLARSETPPKFPSDWKLPTVNRFTRYRECGKLRDFCRSPTVFELRISAIQEIRRHLENVITRDNLDIDFYTVKDGRPYTLVCTKNRATYERQFKQYQDDISYMQYLLESTKELALSTEVIETLRIAVERGLSSKKSTDQ